MKKCIFYLPYKLDEHGMGARMLRPRKMIQAFRDIGYDVCVISGTSKERKIKIREVKKQINSGVKYAFMYSESHTIPTLLTDPGHLPTHPFMDFGFFRFCVKNGIKIGLFYCDIYWKFNYGEDLSFAKRHFALMNYRYDIFQYKRLLSKFYIPDFKICDYIKEQKLTEIAEELPPGAEDITVDGKKREVDNPINIFYVGGIGSQYQILELVKAVNLVPNTILTICCRKNEWEREKESYSNYLCDRIKIVHKNSDELEEFYNEADLCSLLFKNDIYREMAKPFKAYEYLAHEIPVLSTKGTAIGAFVESNNIGWNIDFLADAIKDVLEEIVRNPSILHEKQEKCKITKMQNLWTVRAKKVENDLI